MQPRVLVLLVVTLIAPLLASAQADGWAGEWGSFTRIPPSGQRAAYYVGAGLSISDCSPQACRIALHVSARTYHGEAKGDLRIESDSHAVASLKDGLMEKCALAVDRSSATPPSITVKERAGDCSYFETPGASFAHTYALRTRTPYVGFDIPACFAASDPARQTLCTSPTLSTQRQKWRSLLWEVSDLGPRRDADTELTKLVDSCDSASDPGSCLSQAFDRSTQQLNSIKSKWIASVTDPGDPAAARIAIRAIAGSYKHSFQNGDVQGNNFRATNTLQITPVSDSSIHVVTYLEFFNGHGCKHDGTAAYRRAGFFTEIVPGENGKQCVFEVIPTPKGVRLQDPTGMCRMNDCGVRGGYNGAFFSSAERLQAAPAAANRPSDR